MTVPDPSIVWGAYLFSVLGGAAFAAAWMRAARVLLNYSLLARGDELVEEGPIVWWLPFLLGVVERLIVTTLVAWATTLAPAFIGGWILLKFAVGWQRFAGASVQTRAMSMIALLGNVVSLSTAIWAALWINPSAGIIFLHPN